MPVVGRRRRTDWRGEARSPAEDIAWAARRAAIAVAAAALEARDGGTAIHSDDVVLLCDAVADKLGIRGEQRAYLLAAAQLHDIGKVAVPREILDKAGPLNRAEWAAIHQHTITGQRILESVPELEEVGRIVRSSHERFDGAGYPDGLEGDRIPLESRIVFCADAFHAIRSDRPYRRGTTAAKAMAEVRRNAGTQFDPAVAKALDEAARDLRMANRRRAVAETLDSRRLAALLAALVVSGGALAATGKLEAIVPGDGGDGTEAVSPAEPAAASPRAKPAATAADDRRTRRARRAAATRRANRRRGRAGGGNTPAVIAPPTVEPARGQPPISGHDNGNGKSRGKAIGHAHAPGQLKPKLKAKTPKPKPPAAQQPPPAPPAPDGPGRSEQAPGQIKKQDG